MTTILIAVYCTVTPPGTVACDVAPDCAAAVAAVAGRALTHFSCRERAIAAPAVTPPAGEAAQ